MEIIYWNEKVKKFIDNFDLITSSRIKKTINCLEESGHLIGMPDSKSLGKGLFELRTLGNKQIRILYIFHKNRAYLIHSFIKKAWRLRRKDINYARRIQGEIIRLA